MSDKTVATVQDLLNKLSGPNDGDADTFERAYEDASKALRVIKAEAHHHLGVR